MRVRKHLGFICLMAGSLLSGSLHAAETFDQSIKPFHSKLAMLCPEKHLENLSPGDLNVVIDDYLRGLPAQEEKRMTQAAQPMCGTSIAGVSCANIAFIRAAHRLKTTKTLAKAACQSGFVCREIGLHTAAIE